MEPLSDAWRRLSSSPTFDPRRTKAAALRSPALFYIYFLLNQTLTGRGDSTSVVSLRDFDFLLSIVDSFHMHLGYEVTVSISHQGTSPPIGTILIGLYITQLVHRLGAL